MTQAFRCTSLRARTSVGPSVEQLAAYTNEFNPNVKNGLQRDRDAPNHDREHPLGPLRPATLRGLSETYANAAALTVVAARISRIARIPPLPAEENNHE